MILDEQNLFSDAQVITASAESTNYIDFGTRELSYGEPLEVLIQVIADFATCDTLTVSIQTDDEITFSGPTTLAASAAIATATLKAGYNFSLNFVPKGNRGYMRLYYTIAGSNATTGKITAGIVDGKQQGHHQI